MNRIDRLHALLTTLQSKKVVTAEFLAEKFEVSIRTIYRDLRALEEGGVPIGAEAGVGYYLMEGYHLPPIMFTQEEAGALLLAGKMVEKMSDAQTIRTFRHALTKIQAVLDTSKQEAMETLDNSIVVEPFPPRHGLEQPGDLLLDPLKEALIKKVRITFTYIANHDGAETSREVEPIGLYYYANAWHLIAYCLLRQDYRDFRTDRMSLLRLSSSTFDTQRHPSLQEYIQKLMLNIPLQQVKVRMHTSILRFIRQIKYDMGLLHEHADGVYVEMDFATASLDYFARWMLMLGDAVEIVESEELKEKVKSLVKELGDKYLL